MTRKMRDLGDPIQGPDEPAYFEAAPATDRPPLEDAIRARYAHYGPKLPNNTAAADVRALADEVTALRAELAAARAEGDAFDELVDRTVADANKALAQRDAARAYVALHLSPECRHINAHDGCDETVVCKGRCWCTCHDEDAARAERTPEPDLDIALPSQARPVGTVTMRVERTPEPATGEDVDVLRRLLAHAKAQGWTREPLDITEDGDHDAVYHNHAWTTSDLRRVVATVCFDLDHQGVPRWWVNIYEPAGGTTVGIEHPESAQQVADLLAVVGLAPAALDLPSCSVRSWPGKTTLGHVRDPRQNLSTVETDEREQALREEIKALKFDLDETKVDAAGLRGQVRRARDEETRLLKTIADQDDAANAALADVARLLDEARTERDMALAGAKNLTEKWEQYARDVAWTSVQGRDAEIDRLTAEMAQERARVAEEIAAAIEEDGKGSRGGYADGVVASAEIARQHATTPAAEVDRGQS